MSWSPLRPEHAIERVRFEVRFAETLPKKVVEHVGLRHDAKAGETRFGPRQEQQITNFVVGPTGPVLAPANGVNGVGWLSTRSVGVGNAVVEALALQNGLLSYESSDYRGWTKAFARFQTICLELLTEIGNLVNAASVTLEYTDRFVYQGPAFRATPAGLIDPLLLNTLPESAQSGVELWHVHRGWFEVLGEDKCLINQNVDAQQGVIDFGNEVRSIQIFSKCEIRKEDAGLPVSDSLERFDLLHARSLQLISEVLTKNAAERIGLMKEAIN